MTIYCGSRCFDCLAPVAYDEVLCPRCKANYAADQARRAAAHGDPGEPTP